MYQFVCGVFEDCEKPLAYCARAYLTSVITEQLCQH